MKAQRRKIFGEVKISVCVGTLFCLYAVERSARVLGDKHVDCVCIE